MPYNAMTMPGVACFALPISAAAASFKPLRSNVPTTSRMMMNTAMLLLLTNDEPSVARNPSTPMPPTRAVTIAAAKMMRIASSFSAKPTITINMPNNTR